MPPPRPTRQRPDMRDAPPAMAALLLTAVFFLFAPVMVLAISGLTPARGAAALVFWSIVSGAMGAAWAAAATMRRSLLPVVGVAQAGVAFAFAAQLPPGLGIGRPHPSIEGFAIIGCMLAGYILLVRFIRTQAGQAARMEAELDLARQIHASLVPPLDRTFAGLRVFGRSDASSEMGGDLIDVVERNGTVDVYLADVSGHGVRAGVVMGMLKSALRTRLRSGEDGALGEVIASVNRTIADLCEPNMFATLACLRFEPPRDARLVIAGHPPVLHCSAATGGVRDLENTGLPLGVDAAERFEERSIPCTPGDLFVLYTDGFTEATDARGRQIGLEPIRRALKGSCRLPIEQVFAAIAGAARTGAVGVPEDDQTLLVVQIT